MSASTPERWIAWVRVGAVAFAALEIGVFTESFPEGYEAWAWGITAAFALIALLVSWRSAQGGRSRRSAPPRA